MKALNWEVKRVVKLGLETWLVYRRGTLVASFMSRQAAESLIIRAMGAL